MHDIEIENVEINDADEVFWRCKKLNIKNLKLHGGTYPFMFSSDIRIDGLGKRQQVRFPVCEECGVAQCQNHYEGCLLGGGECDNLRF